MGRFWFIYDVILVVALILQLRYTYNMMKIEEEKSKESNENKKYMIDMKSVQMYCYLLTIKDETNVYEAIIEAGTSKEESMFVWLDDFNFPQAEIENIKEKIEMYFAVKTFIVFSSLEIE